MNIYFEGKHDPRVVRREINTLNFQTVTGETLSRRGLTLTSMMLMLNHGYCSSSRHLHLVTDFGALASIYISASNCYNSSCYYYVRFSVTDKREKTVTDGNVCKVVG